LLSSILEQNTSVLLANRMEMVADDVRMDKGQKQTVILYGTYGAKSVLAS